MQGPLWLPVWKPPPPSLAGLQPIGSVAVTITDAWPCRWGRGVESPAQRALRGVLSDTVRGRGDRKLHPEQHVIAGEEGDSPAHRL